MSEQEALVLAVATRLKAGEAALNLIDHGASHGDGLLHLPMRRHLLAAARQDVNVAKKLLVLHKRTLGDQREILLDQFTVLEARVHNTNIHPGLKPVPTQETS